MDLVTVRGKATLEETGVTIVLDERDLRMASQHAALDDEKHDYERIWNDLFKRVEVVANDDKETRQIVVTYSPTSDHPQCITAVQALLGARESRRLVVFMRSCSATRIQSDLGFFSRMAANLGCTSLTLLIGSLHVELQ